MDDLRVKEEIPGRYSIQKNFFRNFGILFGSRSLGILISIYISILNARLLSKSDFGRYGISISLANIILIPLVFGTNTALLKIIPDTEQSKRGTLAGTVSICNMGLCLIVSLVCLAITPLMTSLLNISSLCWYATILLAVLTNWYMVIETFLKSQQDYFLIGCGKVVSSLCLLGMYIYTIETSTAYSLNLFLIFNLIAQTVLILCVFWRVEGYRLKFDRSLAEKVFKIGFIYMLGWLLSTTLYNIDLYILEVIVGRTDSGAAGSYQAYQVNIRNYFSIFYYDIFAAVLLPTIFHYKIDKEKIYRRIFQLLPLIGMVLFIGTCAVCYILLAAYGGNYGFNLTYITMVALGIAFQGIFFLVNSLLVLEGMDGAKLSLKVFGIPCPLLVAVIVFLTLKYGIFGTFLSFAINQFILMVVALAMIGQKCGHVRHG
jgi:O-antigen/teichoic acid export membrane protein